MPTIELTDTQVRTIAAFSRNLTLNGPLHVHAGSEVHQALQAMLPKPLVPGDIVRSNGDKGIQGTVLGVSGGYVCFDTGNSHGYGNPFRIMLAELLERV